MPGTDEVRSRDIHDWVEARREALIDFTCRLIATPSINPPGDERQVAAVVAEEFQGLGLGDLAVRAQQPERPNLVHRLAGRGDGPVLMYNAHTDTKPVGDVAAAEWRTDPLTPTLLDGRIYGLGSADMKGAVAAFTYAAAALTQIAPDLRGDLLTVFTADEENGSGLGAKYLSETGSIAADVALLGEPSGVDRDYDYLHLVSRGFTAFRVKVLGTQMHSSMSGLRDAVNASAKMARVLERMHEELAFSHEPHPYCPFGVTINIGVQVQGGLYPGVYPGNAEFVSDVRTLPGMTRDGFARDLDAFLERMRAEDPRMNVEWEFLPSPLDWIEPVEIPAEHPLVGQVLAACDGVLDERPELSTFPGGTDATPFTKIAGIPCIPSFGPGMLHHCHGPNEYVPVESVVQAAKIYAVAAAEYLS